MFIKFTVKLNHYTRITVVTFTILIIFQSANADYFIYLRRFLLIAFSCYSGPQLTDRLPSLAEQVS
jgi:hypothetical protein